MVTKFTPSSGDYRFSRQGYLTMPKQHHIFFVGKEHGEQILTETFISTSVQPGDIYWELWEFGQMIKNIYWREMVCEKGFRNC